MSEELETSQVLMPANWKGSLSLNKQAFTASNIKLGGTTYMCKNQKENFVNLPTTGDGCELMRISVTRNRTTSERELSKQAFFSHIKTEVWNCIIYVARWWERDTTKGNGRAYFNLDKDVQCTHHINGGVAFPILCALYYSHWCKRQKKAFIPQLAVETYGTKQYEDSRIVVDLETTIDCRQVAMQLFKRSIERHPFVVKRLSSFIVDRYLLTKDDGNFIFGIGCTTGTTCSSGNPLMTVFNVCPPSWANLPLEEHFANDDLDTSLIRPISTESSNMCYNDEFIDISDLPEENINLSEEVDRPFSQPERLIPFQPLSDKSTVTYSIYGAVLPIIMQPTTVSCKVNDTLNERLNVKCKASVYRLQQYCPTTRHALYEYGRPNPLSWQTGNLSSILSHIPGNSNQTLNVKHMKDNVFTFVNAALNHSEEIATDGAQGRMEVAFICNIKEEPLNLLEYGKAYT